MTGKRNKCMTTCKIFYDKAKDVFALEIELSKRALKNIESVLVLGNENKTRDRLFDKIIERQKIRSVVMCDIDNSGDCYASTCLKALAQNKKEIRMEYADRHELLKIARATKVVFSCLNEAGAYMKTTTTVKTYLPNPKVGTSTTEVIE